MEQKVNISGKKGVRTISGKERADTGASQNAQCPFR